MQVHDSISAVLFQWQKTTECPYLDIGISECNSQECRVSNSKTLDVTIYSKKWDSLTATGYDTNLPITIKPKSNWNTIAIISKEPLSSKKKIMASCSNRLIHKPTKKIINSNKLESFNKYFWTGNSSIIRRDNPTSTQADGIYKDVAISSKTDKGLTYFQWQPSKKCLKLELRNTSFYNNSKEANVNAVNMKEWNKVWDNSKTYCNKKLPCIIKAPNGANSYYIIKVKTNANAITQGYISAFCK